PELDSSSEGGLADEQAGERAAAVHVLVGQHPDAFELGMIQKVGLVEDQDRGSASLGLFGGEGVGGLWDEGGHVYAGHAAEGGDDGVVDAAGADGRVAEVNDRVAGRVERGEGGADGDGLAGA